MSPPKEEKKTNPSEALLDLSRLLLAWYDGNRRDLPWRYAPGQKADPYRVWLSEIMLQQTTVVTVIPYFEKFTSSWPTVEGLAKAPLDDVLLAWAGLGYYARARNLHKCAKAVVSDFGGTFPSDEQALLTLPGIGPYTAAAIASIAFDQHATPMDGNIERVMARLHQVQTPLPDAKPELKKWAVCPTPRLNDVVDYAQALMDLGATICTPRNPNCSLCPCADLCDAKLAGAPEKTSEKENPSRSSPYAAALSIGSNGPQGQVLHPAASRKWAARWDVGSFRHLSGSKHPRGNQMPLPCLGEICPNRWYGRSCRKPVRHTFTHFSFRAGGIGGIWKPARGKPKGEWVFR